MNANRALRQYKKGLKLSVVWLYVKVSLSDKNFIEATLLFIRIKAQKFLLKESFIALIVNNVYGIHIMRISKSYAMLPTSNSLLLPMSLELLSFSTQPYYNEKTCFLSHFSHNKL